jgi:hypothetical protein
MSLTTIATEVLKPTNKSISRWGTSTRLDPRIEFTTINGEVMHGAEFVVADDSNDDHRCVVMKSGRAEDFEVLAELCLAAAAKLRENTK